MFPNGLTVDRSNDIIVADSGNNRVQGLSSDGVFLWELGALGVEDGQFNTPIHVATDNLGHFFVADYQNHRIQKFSWSGITAAKKASLGQVKTLYR